MTEHGKNYDQLHELVETFTERVDEAISQAEEITSDDSQDRDEWRQLVVRVLDAALAVDDAGLRRRVQRLRDTLAASEVERHVGRDNESFGGGR